MCGSETPPRASGFDFRRPWADLCTNIDNTMAHGLSILLLCTLIVIALAGPNDYFTEQDGKQIEKLILSKQDSTTGSFNKNLKDTSLAVHALTNLGAAVPEKEKVC